MRSKINKILFATFILLLVGIPLATPKSSKAATGDTSIPAASYGVLTGVFGSEASLRTWASSMLTMGIVDTLSMYVLEVPSDCLIDIARNTGRPNQVCMGKVLTALGAKLSCRSTYTNGSLLAIATGAYTTMQDTPLPANLAYYFNDVKSDILFGKTSYAGPNSDPFIKVLVVWKGMRNLAYALLAILLLAISIMITLRKKIDAQNVVTAQAMLPKIVISAVLIQFSYAIAALFEQLSGLFGPLTTIARYLAFGSMSGLTEENCPVFAQYLGTCFGETVGMYACTIGGVLQVFSAQGIFGIGIAVLVIGTILMIAIFVLAFLFVYITRYIKVLMLTIFAPIMIAIAVLPGQESKIKEWLLDLAAAVLAIPTMVFFLLLGFYVYWQVVSTSNASFFLGGAFNDVTGLISVLGSMMMFSIWIIGLKSPGMIDKALKGPPPRK